MFEPEQLLRLPIEIKYELLHWQKTKYKINERVMRKPVRLKQ